MTDFVTLTVDGVDYTLPVVTGTEGERGIDISKLRSQTGLITLDDGYGNTGSCQSAITFIDGEKGILRYRGVPIEDLAARSSFIETAELLIFGELPDDEERDEFRDLLTENSALHRDMRKHFDGFPANAHPMSILSAMISALQHSMPTKDMMVRMRLRMRLRTIILVLKLKRRHRKPTRSSRMRLPAFGGLGRRRSAVVSRALFW